MASGGIAITRESHGRQVNQIVGEGMKACLLQAPAPIETNPLHFTEVAVPRPGPGEILVRVHACGVCRTDLHVVEGELPPRKSPIIPGTKLWARWKRQVLALSASARARAWASRGHIAQTAL